MIASAEIAAYVWGTWLLARRDPSGMAYFPETPEVFWKSFWAPVLVAPVAFLLDILSGTFDGTQGLMRPIIVQVIAYVIDAVAFPLAMSRITTEIERPNRYIRFIAAYNWSAVLRTGAFLPVALLVTAAPHLHPLLMAALGVLLVYQTYIAHVALAVPLRLAAAIVLLDLLLDSLIGLTSRMLMG